MMRERQKTRFARHLRRTMTDAEASLWHHLRNRALMGCKFRRQHPLGPYIVDFACIEWKLVIELDGGQHADDPDDPVRSRWIEANGYHVLRFWNNEALQQQQVVLAVIFEALDSSRRDAATRQSP
jgi:very-short-patch-repair endonuclease